MQKITIEPFKVIGISVRTINHADTAAKDIGGLWDRFISQNLLAQIPDKLEDSIYAIYTNYEGDFTQPYDTIIGCKVSTLDNIPEGMVGQTLGGGTYAKFLSKGDMTKGSVYKTWEGIWKEDLKRVYTADFEFYGEKARNPMDGEVDIFVALEA
ncbi:MAG: AraC family transcriptional regulator [Bacteroidetes bacterium]|nr:MAG: AraC family transcriptional regulator [Bacteroidota bacterium]